MKAKYFLGDSGETIEERTIPDSLLEEAEAKRLELIEVLAGLD